MRSEFFTKIVVTGGAGFIGCNFVHFLANKYPKYEIVVLDALTYAGNINNLILHLQNPRIKFYKVDILDSLSIENYLSNGVDTVVNFAAESHVDRSIMDANTFVKTNVLGTQVLLNASLKCGIKKFVQVSTDEVYGTLGSTGYFTELSPILPNSPYSASKASADLLVRSYHETFGLSVNITRCSNNYGPFQFPEKLIPLMIINAIENKPLPLYGDGLNVRDWLHVEDHCSAIDAVIHKGISGEIYNVGGHNERTNLEIVRTILLELGKSESLIKYIADRPGHDRRYAIDATKIRTELGWEPKYTFDNGIQRTIQWYLGNSYWWKSIRDGSYMSYFKEQYGDRLGAER